MRIFFIYRGNYGKIIVSVNKVVKLIDAFGDLASASEVVMILQWLRFFAESDLRVKMVAVQFLKNVLSLCYSDVRI